MKVLLFGARGQLGSEIVDRASEYNIDLAVTDAPDLDICEPLAVDEVIQGLKPEIIINCAAYTQVDKAEEVRDLAFSINAHGAAHIAWSAKAANAYLIHISTDYVFDGAAGKPMTEDHFTNPINVYGESKLLGEKEVIRLLPDNSLILRTSSVHGVHGVNFVHTMIKLMREKKEIKVVNDQFMCTTWAGWLADTILELCSKQPLGVMHACCDGVISWYDFACEIKQLLLPSCSEVAECKVLPVSAEEFIRPAKRPSYSALDCSRLTQVNGKKPITWKEGLVGHFADL